MQQGGHSPFDALSESHYGWMLKSDDGEVVKGHDRTFLRAGVTQAWTKSMNLDFLGLYLCSITPLTLNIYFNFAILFFHLSPYPLALSGLNEFMIPKAVILKL